MTVTRHKPLPLSPSPLFHFSDLHTAQIVVAAVCLQNEVVISTSARLFDPPPTKRPQPLEALMIISK